MSIRELLWRRQRPQRLIGAWLEGALLADLDGNDIIDEVDLDLILVGVR